MDWNFTNIFATLLILILGGSTIYFARNKELKIPEDKVLVDKSYIDSLSNISSTDTIIEYKDSIIYQTQVKYIEPEIEVKDSAEITLEEYVRALEIVKLDVEDSISTEQLKIWTRVQFDYEKYDDWGQPVKSEIKYEFKLPPIIQRTIHKPIAFPYEVTKYVTDKEANLYATISSDLSIKSETFIPSVGLTFITKRNALYGAKIGLYEGKPIYGLTLGFKLF